MVDTKDRIRKAAIAAIARQPYTEHRLQRLLLRRGFAAGDVEPVLSELRASGYVDDAAYARRFVEARLDEHAPRRIASDLRTRGVDPTTITTALASITGGSERNAAIGVLDRRAARYQGLTPEVARRRAAAMLARRGFDHAAIREAIERVLGGRAGDDG